MSALCGVWICDCCLLSVDVIAGSAITVHNRQVVVVLLGVYV